MKAVTLVEVRLCLPGREAPAGPAAGVVLENAPRGRGGRGGGVKGEWLAGNGGLRGDCRGRGKYAQPHPELFGVREAGAVSPGGGLGPASLSQKPSWDSGEPGE